MKKILFSLLSFTIILSCLSSCSNGSGEKFSLCECSEIWDNYNVEDGDDYFHEVVSGCFDRVLAATDEELDACKRGQTSIENENEEQYYEEEYEDDYQEAPQEVRWHCHHCNEVFTMPKGKYPPNGGCVEHSTGLTTFGQTSIYHEWKEL